MILRELRSRQAFGPTVRARLWRKLAVQIRHGLDLTQSIRGLRNRAQLQHSPLALVYVAVLDNLDAGHSLGASLTGFAPTEELMLISGGQKSGRLAECLELAANLIEARQRIGRAMREALAYPAFLLSLVVILLVVISGYVVPRLTVIADPDSWTGMARVMYVVATFVGSPAGVLSFAFCCVLVALITFSMPRWTGPLRQTADRFAPWSMYRLMVGTIWLYTLATLMQAGMQLSHILDDMLASEELTPWLRERVSAIHGQYQEGVNLGEAMAKAGTGFPDAELVDELRDYATLPDFHARLHDIAGQWLANGVDLIEQQARILRVVCILLIISIVCGLLLAMGSLQQQLTTIMGGGI